MTQTLRQKFGTRLAELRREKGFTQEQLADRIGLTVESVSNMERGVYGPRFDTLEALSQTLKVPVKALFDF